MCGQGRGWCRCLGELLGLTGQMQKATNQNWEKWAVWRGPSPQEGRLLVPAALQGETGRIKTCLPCCPPPLSLIYC